MHQCRFNRYGKHQPTSWSFFPLLSLSNNNAFNDFISAFRAIINDYICTYDYNIVFVHNNFDEYYTYVNDNKWINIFKVKVEFKIELKWTYSVWFHFYVMYYCCCTITRHEYCHWYSCYNNAYCIRETGLELMGNCISIISNELVKLNMVFYLTWTNCWPIKHFKKITTYWTLFELIMEQCRKKGFTE